MISIPGTIASNTKTRYFVTPVLIAFFGFLVYFTLFESFSRDRDLMKGVLSGKEWLQSLYYIWKIVVFSFTIWFVNNKSYSCRQNTLIIGALMAVVSAVLLFIFSLYNLNSAPTIFIVDGISAIGEGLLSAGIVTYIRGYAQNDNIYSNLTTSLRIGQNCGMVASLFVGREMWQFQYEYPAFLILLPITVLCIAFHIRNVVKDLPPITRIVENVKLKMNVRMMVNVITGISASGLFYLLVLGPMILFEDKDIYNQSFTFEINGCFSVMALVVILIIMNLIKNKQELSTSFDKIVLLTKKALIMNALFWMAALVLFYIDYSNVTPIYLAGGILGLFSTSSYVLGELSSGIKGRKQFQTKQVLTYLSLTRIGPVISLLIIAICRFFIDMNLMKPLIALLLLEFIVVLGICGVYYTIKAQPKQLI